jgi:5-methylcytosine-specific restriction protein A
MATERIRGRKRQTIRAAHFKANPLCVMCTAKGKTSLATELDHITPLFKGGKEETENRQGLCSACHAIKTAKDLGYTPRARFDKHGRVVW